MPMTLTFARPKSRRLPYTFKSNRLIVNVRIFLVKNLVPFFIRVKLRRFHF